MLTKLSLILSEKLMHTYSACTYSLGGSAQEILNCGLCMCVHGQNKAIPFTYTYVMHVSVFYVHPVSGQFFKWNWSLCKGGGHLICTTARTYVCVYGQIFRILCIYVMYYIYMHAYIPKPFLPMLF